jgi:hypothetical protein
MNYFVPLSELKKGFEKIFDNPTNTIAVYIYR